MAEQAPTHWHLLGILKENQRNYCSGPALASQLSISRTSIWKHIQKLRSAGYSIHSHPRLGYQLIAVPDLLLPEEIIPHLKTSAFARTYVHIFEVGSTNDHALSLASHGAPHGTVVVAEQQTKGRGRLRRPWESAPHHGIYLSIILRSPLPPDQAPPSTQVAALALAKVLRRDYELPATIKWPNDILIENRKVAGILTEIQSDQDLVRFMVIGIGINVNHTASDLRGPFRYPATSLARELQHHVERQGLLLTFIHQFEADYRRFLAQGFEAIRCELEEASAILGKTVKITRGQEDFSGKALGFTSQGALRLLTREGKEIIVWVGDVSQVETDL